jgi:hypothetical protein
VCIPWIEYIRKSPKFHVNFKQFHNLLHLAVIDGILFFSSVFSSVFFCFFFLFLFFFLLNIPFIHIHFQNSPLSYFLFLSFLHFIPNTTDDLSAIEEFAINKSKGISQEIETQIISELSYTNQVCFLLIFSFLFSYLTFCNFRPLVYHFPHHFTSLTTLLQLFLKVHEVFIGSEPVRIHEHHVDAIENGVTPFWLACYYGNLRAAVLLLRLGANGSKARKV